MNIKFTVSLLVILICFICMFTKNTYLSTNFDSIEIYEFKFNSDSYPGLDDILKDKSNVIKKVVITKLEDFKISKSHFTNDKSLTACFHPHHAIVIINKEIKTTYEICFSCLNYSKNDGVTLIINDKEKLLTSLNKLGFSIDKYR